MVKFHKYQTLVLVFSLVILAISLVAYYSAVRLAGFVAEGPITPFFEEHIIHRSLNSETLVKNWGNLLKGISGTGVLFALFLLFMVREKWLPFFKSVRETLKNTVSSEIFTTKALQSARRTYFERLCASLWLVFLGVTRTKLFLFLFCGFWGAAFFVTSFGIQILDVTYTDWLMAGGDLSQHYMGWCMFRESAWHFPIGLMDNIVYPFKESIIYTDSIPLFAVLFKLFSPLLPENFQYFGIFGLLIYFLQGATAALVVQKLCKNSFFCIIGSVFFIFSTTMMQRIYGHTSLGAHFIILLCIYASITYNTGRTLRRNLFVWGGLFCLAASIHLYFVPMVFAFMVVCFIKDFLEIRRLRENIISGVASLVILFVTMFVLGAFYSGADYSAGLLGESSMNINAFVNPQGDNGHSIPVVTSRFLQPLPLAAAFKYEGYGYLGFGVLLACFFFVCFAFYKTNEIKRILKNTMDKRNIVLIGSLFLFFFIFALSPVITFNSKEIFRFYIPVINHVWSIFQSTGRYVWVLMYMIMCGICWAVKKTFGTKKGFLVLCALLAVQYLDLKDYFSGKGNAFKQRILWASPLVSDEWAEIAANKKHIFFVEGYPQLYPLMDFALDHDLTTNDSYLARKNTRQIEQHKDEEKIRILVGNANGETLYVFETEEEAEKYKTMLAIFIMDGVIVGVKK